MVLLWPFSHIAPLQMGTLCFLFLGFCLGVTTANHQSFYNEELEVLRDHPSQKGKSCSERCLDIIKVLKRPEGWKTQFLRVNSNTFLFLWDSFFFIFSAFFYFFLLFIFGTLGPIQEATFSPAFLFFVFCFFQICLKFDLWLGCLGYGNKVSIFEIENLCLQIQKAGWNL